METHSLLQSIPDVIFVFQPSGFIVFVSPSCKALLGYDPEEMIGKSFLDFVHTDDIDKTLRFVNRQSKSGVAKKFDNRYYRKDGSPLSLLWSGRWEPNDNLFYCVARDNSEYSELEHRLQKAQELALMASYEFDLETGRYTHVSDSFYSIFGIERKAQEAFSLAQFWMLVHPADRQRVQQSALQVQPGEQASIEYRIIRPDGAVRYIHRQREVWCNSEGKAVRVLGTIQDITERKTAEATLFNREERFRYLMQNGNDMFGIIANDGTYRFVGDNVLVHLGYHPEELVGQSVLYLVHPDDLEMAGQALRQITVNKVLTVGPFRIRNNKGEWRWVETTASNHLSNPLIEGIVINSRDVTEKKLREDALESSERLFKALVRNGSDLIVILDEQSCFTYLSENVGSLMGYEPSELLGRPVFDYIHEEDQVKVSTELKAMLEHTDASAVQHRFRHKSGKWVWLESKGSNHLHNNSIRGVLVNARNIDDRKKLHDRLSRERGHRQRAITAAVIRAQEQERTLLGLELHDNVNQVLTTVKLYTEMFVSGYITDKQVLVKSAQFTQDCINEIRTISKRLSVPTLGNISLQESITELVRSVNLAQKTVFHISVSLEPAPVISEELHLTLYRIVQESVNNILKYAAASDAWITIEHKDQHLLLMIRDNGLGFDVSTRKAGIGIANMKTRADSQHGRFKVQSRPGAGTVIRASFPLEEAPTIG
ncbi:sensor histidine kinase [Cnuella takakiae]|uniref:sensor histidine kinase n=1 Tax=Cnuella takakiae TaxID=1302690 RepID=UPI000934DEAB|nr:PAS domain S-box protein [Cnuella takakiae]